MEDRYVTPDVRKDVMIGGIVSIPALAVTSIVLIGSIIIGMIWMQNSPFKLLLFVGISTLITFMGMVAEVPTWIKRLIGYMQDKRGIKSLDDLEHIEKYSGKCLLKDKKESVFIEVNAEPWSVSPNRNKLRRMHDFAEDVFSTVDEKGSVHINIQCTEDETTILDRRFKKLSSYPEGLRDLERERIDHHYKLSKFARRFTYTVRIDHGKNKEKSVAERTFIEGDFLGGQAIEQRVNDHLTPDAPIERGEE